MEGEEVRRAAAAGICTGVCTASVSVLGCDRRDLGETQEEGDAAAVPAP